MGGSECHSHIQVAEPWSLLKSANYACPLVCIYRPLWLQRSSISDMERTVHLWTYRLKYEWQLCIQKMPHDIFEKCSPLHFKQTRHEADCCKCFLRVIIVWMGSHIEGMKSQVMSGFWVESQCHVSHAYANDWFPLIVLETIRTKWLVLRVTGNIPPLKRVLGIIMHPFIYWACTVSQGWFRNQTSSTIWQWETTLLSLKVLLKTHRIKGEDMVL